MPFKFKKHVFDAAVTSFLTYSTESWFSKSVKPIEEQYNQLVKCLLGVRRNTSITLCMAEAGIPHLSDVISKRCFQFLKSKFEIVDCDQPFHYVYQLCHSKRTPAVNFISNVLSYNCNVNPLSKVADEIRLRSVNGTKFSTYINELNLYLSQHSLYTSNFLIPDYQREAFSRLRLMSHSLRIETSRWYRTPRHLRVCPCDEVTVQSEKHVLLECPMTDANRLDYPMLNFTDLRSLLDEANFLGSLCGFICDVLIKFSYNVFLRYIGSRLCCIHFINFMVCFSLFYLVV